MLANKYRLQKQEGYTIQNNWLNTNEMASCLLLCKYLSMYGYDYIIKREKNTK